MTFSQDLLQILMYNLTENCILQDPLQISQFGIFTPMKLPTAYGIVSEHLDTSSGHSAYTVPPVSAPEDQLDPSGFGHFASVLRLVPFTHIFVLP